MEKRITIKDIRAMDRILKYLVQHNSRFNHIDDFSKSNYGYYDVTISKSKIKELFTLSDEKFTKYFQILLSRNTSESIFIAIRNDRCWIMDSGIYFYYQGGFIREQLKGIVKSGVKVLETLLKIVSTIDIRVLLFFILFIILG